jgi:hypothetical protein
MPQITKARSSTVTSVPSGPARLARANTSVIAVSPPRGVVAQPGSWQGRGQLVGLPVSASVPFPQVGNVGNAAAVARGYLHNLHAGARRPVAGGWVADSDAAKFVAENWDASALPEPLNPADLADALWYLYLKRDPFEEIVGSAGA